MAIWNKDNQALMQDNKTLFEGFVQMDQYGTAVGAHGMGGATQYSAFGEMSTIQLTPVIQLDGIYGLEPAKFETFTAFGGSVSTPDSMMQVSTGTNQYGYGVLRSRRVLRYRPGQGANARFTAMFTQGVAGYTQRAGLFTQEQALMVGYDGDKFGILRQTGGKATIYRLNVTAAASGAETVTITLNGVAYNINVTAGPTSQNCATIGTTAFAGWIVEYDGADVTFLSSDLGPKAGAFTVSSTGTFAGNMQLLQQGVADAPEWTYQEDWNLDKLDGTGPSGMALDPTKLNVFQIHYRWLGAGQIAFAVENSENGDMIYFHHIHYSNKNTTPHIANPTFKIGYVAASSGGSGTDVKVSGASMMGAIEGQITPTALPRAQSTSRTSLNSAGTEYHMMSLKNRVVFASRINVREVILKSISAGAVSAAGVPAIVKLYFNAPMATNLQYSTLNAAYDSVYVSKTETTHTGTTDIPLYQFIIAPGATETIDLSPLRIVIPPNNSVSVVITSGGNMSNAYAALTWIED